MIIFFIFANLNAFLCLESHHFNKIFDKTFDKTFYETFDKTYDDSNFDLMLVSNKINDFDNSETNILSSHPKMSYQYNSTQDENVDLTDGYQTTLNSSDYNLSTIHQINFNNSNSSNSSNSINTNQYSLGS